MANLIEIFDKALMQEPSRKKKNPQFKIKPSMIGSPCERKIYYSAAGVEEDYGFDLAGKKRLVLGDAIGDMLHKIFKKAGVIVPYVNPDGSVHRKFGFAEETEEFPVECADIYIKNGYIDAVMIIDGELWITEYKSINTNGFNSLTAPKKDHMIQGVIYWYVFNLLLSEGKFSHIPQLQGFTQAKGVRWLYLHKDDTNLKEYTMTQGDEFFTQIVNKILAARKNYDTKTLPPKTPDFCNTCPWRTKCKNNFNIE